jgi:excisionase family DNA binding protein
VSEPLLYTPEEAARLIRQSRASVYKFIGTGELESVTIGRSRRVTRTGIERFIDSHLAASKG